MKYFAQLVLCVCGCSFCNIWGQEHNHVQIAQQNMPAVVTVNVLTKDASTLTATGFIVSSDGWMITNQHVLKEALYVNITFSNGATSGEAVLLAQNKQADLALLKIEAQHLPHVTLANTDTVWPGQTITVIGNPRRLQNTVTSGIISQLRTQADGTLWHQISAPISPSSSGSPVFNAQGEVISVACASLTGTDNQNLNFAIPVRYVKQLLAEQHLHLPESAPKEKEIHPFLRHIQKSWEITKRLFRRWSQGTQS